MHRATKHLYSGLVLSISVAIAMFIGHNIYNAHIDKQMLRPLLPACTEFLI